MKVGDKIRILRKINNITLNELSEAIGISIPSLRKIENNQVFVDKKIIYSIISRLNYDDKELMDLYYKQNLEKEIIVKSKGGKVFIIIPKEISKAFDLEDNQDIFVAFLNKKIILQHKETDNYNFEKRKIVKDQYSFIFFLGKNLDYIKGQKIRVIFNVIENNLVILY
ncbi:Helix-turn-helix domain-containing protein [Cetobacterium ceti]|uniref:Helix-turn-helix domain-containing protein n=1 Tax=Cetobacterium ceti TaxID=180163 RepID=A0A1T4R9A2_9FUSO|nr:helix-turn-helix transcriptional regulator [Cetobacterium ceti]SKA12248.1 Helix-turn-helix domain-containing protein [Cetobacterium ceti]